MQRTAKSKLTDAIQDRASRTSGQAFKPDDMASAVMQELALGNPAEWASIRDTLVLDAVAAGVRGVMRSMAKSDDRQTWLPFPKFEHIPEFIEVDEGWVNIRSATLEQYRQQRDALKAKLAVPEYPRRSDVRFKREHEILEEMDALEKRIAPYFARNPAMTVGLATELYRARLESARAERSRPHGVKGGRPKKAPTKNQ